MPIGTGLAIAGIASAAGSIGSAAIGARAAGKASDAQVQAAREQQALYEPFRQAGMGALPQLTEGTAPGGGLIAPWTGEFKAPTVTDDPGYQFRLQQGQLALERSAAARGGLTTGGTIKATEQYAQGLASQEYGNAYARALTEYGLGRENFWQNQENAYNRLSGMAGLGMAGAERAGGAIGQAGAARASGYLGSGEAWAGGLQGATRGLTDYLTLQNVFGQGGGGYPGVKSIFNNAYKGLA